MSGKLTQARCSNGTTEVFFHKADGSSLRTAGVGDLLSDGARCGGRETSLDSQDNFQWKDSFAFAASAKAGAVESDFTESGNDIARRAIAESAVTFIAVLDGGRLLLGIGFKRVKELRNQTVA